MLNYIPHPSNCRLAGGVLRLRIEEGSAGYGVYWMILELLRDAENYRIQNNPKAIAFAINEPDIALVSRVMADLSLFDQDNDGNLFSPWLLAQMEAYDGKKRKLQEAGRRGAAKRYGATGSGDGQAIATPSMEDGQAIATNITKYNLTQPNVIERNPTQAVASGSAEDMDVSFLLNLASSDQAAVTDDFILEVSKTGRDGSAPAYVAQICRDYGISVGGFRALCQVTEGGHKTNTRYQALVSEVKRIQGDRFRPDHPLNFFLKKIL